MCSREGCTNGAYYLFLSSPLCGVHSRLTKLKTTKNNIIPQCSLCPNPAIGWYQQQPYCERCTVRTNLPKRSIADRQLEQQHRDIMIESYAKKNKQEGRRGSVIVSKMKMMKKVEHREGYLAVFPNFKHGGRTDGIGLPNLSPKAIGPIIHPQPGLPPAGNLENFWQFLKCFPSEVDINGNPLQKFFETQLKGYLDETPHRHKEEATGNIPLYILWRLPDIIVNGVVTPQYKRLSYFEARQIYCTYYERFVTKMPEFIDLVSRLDNGYNLNLIGYDGYEVVVPEGITHKDYLEQCYKDISRPFGHELVLYTLLTEGEEGYPWRKYTTEIF